MLNMQTESALFLRPYFNVSKSVIMTMFIAVYKISSCLISSIEMFDQI